MRSWEYSSHSPLLYEVQTMRLKAEELQQQKITHPDPTLHSATLFSAKSNQDGQVYICD